MIKQISPSLTSLNFEKVLNGNVSINFIEAKSHKDEFETNFIQEIEFHNTDKKQKTVLAVVYEECIYSSKGLFFTEVIENNFLEDEAILDLRKFISTEIKNKEELALYLLVNNIRFSDIDVQQSVNLDNFNPEEINSNEFSKQLSAYVLEVCLEDANNFNVEDTVFSKVKGYSHNKFSYGDKCVVYYYFYKLKNNNLSDDFKILREIKKHLVSYQINCDVTGVAFH